MLLFIYVEHQRIVATLARRFDSMSVKPCANTLVDLAIIKGRSGLFLAVKTVNNENLLDQVRLAIAQLMKYQLIYKNIFERIALSFVAQLWVPSLNLRLPGNSYEIAVCIG